MATRRPPPPTSPDPPPAAAEEEDEGNQLEVGRVLPATGLFTVFRATLGRGDGDAAQPLDVAVKVLPIHRPAAGALLRELAPLAVAAVHPHLVPYVALFRRSREVWVASRYETGGTVAAAAAAAGGLVEPALVAALRPAVAGLAFLHAELGIVHGAVKATNLLVGASGAVGWTDYGVAAFLAAALADRACSPASPAGANDAPGGAYGEEGWGGVGGAPRAPQLASLRTPYIPIDVLTRVAVAAPADMGDHDADGVCAVGGSAAAGAGRFPPPRGAVEMALTAVAGAPAARSAAAGTSVAAASAAGMAEGADDAAVRVLLRMMHRMRH